MPRHQFTHFVTTVIIPLAFCLLNIAELSAANPPIQKANSIYQEGMAYLKRRQFELAIAAFQKAIQENPDHVEAYNYMGEAYYELAEYRKAKAAFEKALRLNPRHIRAKLNLEVVRWQLPSFEVRPIAERPRVTGVSEILLQVFGGYSRGAAVSGLMYLSGYLVGIHNNQNRAGLIITGVGMAVGSTVQVYQTGEVWGKGGGSRLKTFAGGLLGPLIGALMMTWNEKDSMDSILAGASYGSFLSPIGATFGYQLSKGSQLGVLGYHRSILPVRQPLGPTESQVFMGYSQDVPLVAISMGFQF